MLSANPYWLIKVDLLDILGSISWISLEFGLCGSERSVTLHLNSRGDGGCPIEYFIVKYRGKGSQDWTLVNNNVKASGDFVFLDLEPAQWYNLRVTAHNKAGSTMAQYEFPTLTETGGTIAPARETDKDNYLLAMLMNLNLIVPAAVAILVIIAAIVVICVIKGRNNVHKGEVVYNKA